LKITELETIPLRLPFAQPFKISQGGDREAIETLIVRVHTDEGIVGIGETQAWRRQGSAELLWSLVHTVKDHFEPMITGRSPFDVAGIVHALNEALDNTLYAQAAVADALYDIAGKAVGLPVHKLLGGECRDRVRIAGLLAMKPTVAELLESAQAFYDRGFRHFGLKIGVDPRQDLANVVALRNHFGDRIVLRVDANGALSYDAALSLLRKLEPYDIDAAEQPIAIWDLEGLAALCRATSIPIMADESVSTDHSLLEVIRRRAATVVQTKIAKNGGMYRVWRLWALASAAAWAAAGVREIDACRAASRAAASTDPCAIDVRPAAITKPSRNSTTGARTTSSSAALPRSRRGLPGLMTCSRRVTAW